VRKRAIALRLAVPGALVLVVATATAAYAGGNLPSGSLVAGTTTQQYSYTTQYDYWSVTAVQPTATSDYDLTLYDVTGAPLASSTYGTGKTDFVAVDSNIGTRKFQTYYPDVTLYTAGSFWVQAQYGARAVALPTPTHHGTTGFSDPDIAYITLNSDDVVSIEDIYLTAGQSFWAVSPTAASQLYLLEANTASPASYVQSRYGVSLLQHTQAIDNCTLYTASITGWHALVMVRDSAPTVTNPVQGIAFGLHKYDPTQPTYCPMANFPAATP
jgi:hypothetical protein